jgi:hypothetical protein
MKLKHAYTPEMVGGLRSALEAALTEIETHHEWVGRLGPDLVKEIAGRTIAAAADHGTTVLDELSAMAVRAVKVKFLTSKS